MGDSKRIDDDEDWVRVWKLTWRSPSWCIESMVTLVKMCSLRISNYTHSFITMFLDLPSFATKKIKKCVCWDTLWSIFGQFRGYVFREVLSVSVPLRLWTAYGSRCSLPPSTPHTAVWFHPKLRLSRCTFPDPCVYMFNHCICAELLFFSDLSCRWEEKHSNFCFILQPAVIYGTEQLVSLFKATEDLLGKVYLGLLGLLHNFTMCFFKISLI